MGKNTTKMSLQQRSHIIFEVLNPHFPWND